MAQVSQGEEKRRGTLLNKLIITHLSIPVSFSVKPDDAQVLEKFFEIAKREGGTRGRSKVFVKAMTEYNQRHEEGNPNMKITTYMPNAQKSPMRVLCWSKLAGATSDGQVYCRRAESWIRGVTCYSCNENQLRKKKQP